MRNKILSIQPHDLESQWARVKSRIREVRSQLEQLIPTADHAAAPGFRRSLEMSIKHLTRAESDATGVVQYINRRDRDQLTVSEKRRFERVARALRGRERH
jgi:hypothetical protein